MYKTFIVIVILILLLSLPVYPVQDKVNYLSISAVEGSVEKRVTNNFFNLLRIKTWHEITEDESLKVGDRIRTSENSKIELYFSNGTYVIVDPRSEIVIGKGKITEAGTTASLKLKQGRIWSKVKKVWQGLTKFEVITPSAVAGVRGTIFSVMVKGDKVLLSVKEGQVEFKTLDEKDSVSVTQGYMSLVESGKLKKPVLIDKEENKQWEKVKKLINKNKNNKNIPEDGLGNGTKGKGKPDDDKDADKKGENRVKDEEEGPPYNDDIVNGGNNPQDNEDENGCDESPQDDEEENDSDDED